MRDKTIAVLVLVVLAGALVSSPVMAAENSRAMMKVCTGNRYTMRGWVCVDVPPERDIYTLHLSQKKAGIDSSRNQGPPGRQPDPALASMPYHYLEILDTRVPLYRTLDQAVAGRNPKRHLIPGFDYVAFDHQVQINGKWFYRTATNLWIPGREAAYLGRISSFQGLIFDAMPRTDFGWVLAGVESQSRPKTTDPELTGTRYQRYDVVRIFDEQVNGDYKYLKVGEDEWLPAESVGRVTRRSGPPEGMEGERWIDVNLNQQTLAVYDRGELVFATLVATGVEGNWTRPGTFRIKKKLETEVMRGSFAADRSDYYYLENVPWTMYFDESRALHGTYWHDNFGIPQSKGCVNLSPGDAHWIFNWAEEGDRVHVYDPSGETPTDPELFHSGGA